MKVKEKRSLAKEAKLQSVNETKVKSEQTAKDSLLSKLNCN